MFRGSYIISIALCALLGYYLKSLGSQIHTPLLIGLLKEFNYKLRNDFVDRRDA